MGDGVHREVGELGVGQDERVRRLTLVDQTRSLDHGGRCMLGC